MDQEVTYICEVCKQKIPISNENRNNCLVLSLVSSFVCAKCSKLFSMVEELTEMKLVSNECGDTSQPCIALPSTSFDCDDGTGSMPKDSNDGCYKCEFCGMNFKNKITFNGHKHIHKETFKCELCSKCCTSKYELKIHSNKHSNERRYTCRFCSRTFKYKNGLKTHMHLHDVNNLFTCRICNKKWESKRLLERHMSKYSDERHYECSICFRSYKRKHDLNRHMKKHD